VSPEPNLRVDSAGPLPGLSRHAGWPLVEEGLIGYVLVNARPLSAVAVESKTAADFRWLRDRLDHPSPIHVRSTRNATIASPPATGRENAATAQ